MYLNRVKFYQEIEKIFDTKLLVYVTGDRTGLSAQISQDVIDFFIGHLDKIGVVPKISLYLYTRGGETAAAWNIINLLRMYCDTLQVIIPHKAHSAGTIISLGANEIVMTKQATLGPIDPSINTPLNPSIANNPLQTYPVSVEAVKGYMEFAKDELSISDPAALAGIYTKLTDSVHPLVLGQVYRTRAQIKMLAGKLLINQVDDETTKNKIIAFLCSESGSHDYTINRREAEQDLGLKIKKPTYDQYKIIKALYDDISNELCLTQPFSVENINGRYSARRCLLESIVGGSDYFSTEGQVVFLPAINGQNVLQHKVLFNGWRHDSNTDLEQTVVNNNGEQEVQYGRSDDFQV